MSNVTLITGVGEDDHVSSTDQQAINQGMIGCNRYVYTNGNKLEAVRTASNTITIKDGVFCVGGCFGRIPSGAVDEITIENGETGVNRTDLIVLEYKKTSGIEKLDWKVKKGTTSYTSGDVLSGDTLIEFPMYKVTLTGMDITKIEKMFKSVSPAGENADGWCIALTKTVNPTNVRVVKLYTWEELSEAVGVTLTSNDRFKMCVSVCNGHWEGNRALPVSVSLRDSGVYVHLDAMYSGNMRFNIGITYKK